MEKEENIFEVMRNLSNLKEDLENITSLKKKIFKIFKGTTRLEKINEIGDDSIDTLYYWDCSSGLRKCDIYLKLPEESVIRDAFYDIKEANINRDEFYKILEESKIRECIESYITKIEERISEEQIKLDNLYNKFVERSGELSFIFKEPRVKELIINKLLQL